MLDERLKSHYESLSRAIWFTRTADAKAAPVLAVQVALAGTLAARFERLAPVLAREAWGAESIVLVGSMVLYALFLVASVVAAASVYLPRNPRTGRSLIYYEDIAAMPIESFKRKASRVAPATVEVQLLDQVHMVSLIASTKMYRVRWAYYLSAPSVVLWVILLAWGKHLISGPPTPAILVLDFLINWTSVFAGTAEVYLTTAPVPGLCTRPAPAGL